MEVMAIYNAKHYNKRKESEAIEMRSSHVAVILYVRFGMPYEVFLVCDWVG